MHPASSSNRAHEHGAVGGRTITSWAVSLVAFRLPLTGLHWLRSLMGLHGQQSWGQLTALMGLALLGCILGLGSALLPAWFVFSVLLVPALAVLAAIRPEYALTACVALVCGLIHPGFVPRIPVLGGSLAAADAALAMLSLLAVWTLAATSEHMPAAPVAGARVLLVSLSLFALTLAVSVVLSLLVWELNPTTVLGETRDLVYWLVLPLALVILHSRERQHRFVVSFVVLGCLFAVGQVLQGVFHIPVFGAQGISALETLGRQEDTTTRANTLGLNVIIFALFLTVSARLVGVLRLVAFLPIAGLLGVGIVLTFGRTTYAVVLICLLLLVWWLNPKRLPGFVLGLLAAVAAGSVLAMLWKPDSFAALVFRMTTIGQEIDYGYSAQWRFWEFKAMLPHILEHPFTGIGLGADYKGLSGSSAHPELNRYMHNAYFYMAGKMGLPALAFVGVALVTIFVIGRRLAKRTGMGAGDGKSGPEQPWLPLVGAACAAMVIRFVFASVTEPHLMSDYGVINMAIAGALVVLFARQARLAHEKPEPESV